MYSGGFKCVDKAVKVQLNDTFSLILIEPRIVSPVCDSISWITDFAETGQICNMYRVMNVFFGHGLVSKLMFEATVCGRS